MSSVAVSILPNQNSKAIVASEKDAKKMSLASLQSKMKSHPEAVNLKLGCSVATTKSRSHSSRCKRLHHFRRFNWGWDILFNLLDCKEAGEKVKELGKRDAFSSGLNTNGEGGKVAAGRRWCGTSGDGVLVCGSKTVEGRG
ncbi:hypothetical protein ACH5RR_018785 [Cinchona calisaya]|uniref:Uncharacterized protein n=1 Tax=Cinchona calisaya TaxID=153742 RepID=A0ABD2ZMK9_9GENT